MSSFWLILKQQWTIKISSPLFYILSLVAILVGSRDHRTQFWKGPFKDHSTKVWLQLAQWFLRRRLKCEMLTDGRKVMTLVRVYNVHGLSKKIAVGNVRIKYQSYIFFSPLSMLHLLGEFKNHLSLFLFNKVAKY